MNRISHEPRIAVGKSASLHAAYDPAKCPDKHTGMIRTVDCCGQKDDQDVLECSDCGFQFTARCNYDDDTA